MRRGIGSFVPMKRFPTCIMALLGLLPMVGCSSEDGPSGSVPFNNETPGSVLTDPMATVIAVRCVSRPSGSDGKMFENIYIEVYSDGTEKIQSKVISDKNCE